VIVVEVARISDSCGYGVPFMNFEAHRPTMDQWAKRKGLQGIRDYWAEKNRRSIDDSRDSRPCSHAGTGPDRPVLRCESERRLSRSDMTN